MISRTLRTARLGLAGLALSVLAAIAAEARPLYDDATLAAWKPRYERSTTRILNEVVLPALTAEERRRLGPVPPIDFPQRPAGDWSAYPLAFYVPGHRRAITMPISSLKLLDDICTAYAWLQTNGYAIETVSEYTAIIRHGKEPPGGFPPPLEALGIPADALDDDRVDSLALGHFVTARTFLVAHELGHVLYRHSYRTRAESRRNEEEADRFAFRLMGRTPLPPIGALLFFMADAHWSYVDENPNATHPMSGARIRAAANWVDDPVFAGQLLALGEFLDDPDIRLGLVATGKAGDLAALAPRRPGEPPRRTGTRDRAALGGAAFDGRYAGYFTQSPDPEQIPVEVVLERTGDRVIGWYSFGLGFGRIEGTVAGERLEFDWTYADSYGRGVLHAAGGGFRGTWGYREARRGAGEWIARR